MRPRMDHFSRRDFMSGLTAAGSAGLLGLRHDPARAEAPPQTTIRFPKVPALCNAPQWIAGELLKGEGFTDVQHVQVQGPSVAKPVGSGQADLAMCDVPSLIMDLEAAELPIVSLMGVHAGCYDLWATNQIKSIRDLKGKTVSVPRIGFGRHAFVATMVASVGLDIRRDVNWVEQPQPKAMAFFAEGRIDALMTFAPAGQELRAKKVGHVLVNTGMDRPWSQYFCCLVIGNREFVERNPAATKRALRAIVKASEVCALEPERVAQQLVDRGFTDRYDDALQTLKEIPSYGKWRQYSAADSLRFYALRFHEAGFLKSSPQRFVSQYADWRFADELKRELKG